MNIGIIPADYRIKMTPELLRAFRIENCEPACHCCDVYITAGDYFKLAFIEDYNTDEMLCDDCTTEKFINKIEAAKEATRKSRMGYTRPHQHRKE